MNARASMLLFAAIFSVTLSSVALAHHSISAEFDAGRRVMLSGTITKVAWTNPHSFFYVDVKDSKTGGTVSWMCELGSPNMLSAIGWTHNTLKVGMSVSFTGILARDGTHKVIARNIVADGNKVIAWPSEQTAQ